MTDRRTRLEQAHLYLVCDARESAFLDAALRGGVDIVQLRMKDASDEAIRAAASRFIPVCAAHDALFILNDRPDLAAAVGADGVHVGQDDTAVAEARRIVGDDALVGLSTHTPAQVDGAAGADYIGVGPVHATPTKAGRPAVGLELVRYAALNSSVPFFAIGGLDTANVSAVARAGATRIAVVRAIGDAFDVEAAAGMLRAAVSGAPVVRA